MLSMITENGLYQSNNIYNTSLPASIFNIDGSLVW